jgi:hypothetical protein
MILRANAVSLLAIAVTGLSALYAARKVYRDRTRANDARLICLCGLLVMLLPTVFPITGAAMIATGAPGLAAVLYGVFSFRSEYVKTLHS